MAVHAQTLNLHNTGIIVTLDNLAEVLELRLRRILGRLC